MSDVRHYARAREHLESDDMNQAGNEAATLNARLAVSVAAREICKELRNSLAGINGRLHDVMVALEPDAGLVGFTSESSPIWINPRQVVAVTSDADDITTIHAGIGRDFIVDVDLNAAAMKLGVSA